MIINQVYLRRIKKPKLATKIEQLPTETIVQPKPLFLILQRVYFDEILAGTKTKEYRGTKFYFSRFVTKDGTKFKNYETVIFQEGYHKNARRMTVKIRKITLTFRFVIHLGEIIDKNF